MTEERPPTRLVHDSGSTYKQIPMNVESNSHRDKVEKERPEKEVQQVATGSIRKKSLGKKFAETFTGEDARSVVRYIVADVMVPALQKMLIESASRGMERLFFGESSPRPGGGPRIGYTSYSQVSRRNDPPWHEHRSASRERNPRPLAAVHDFDDIFFATRGEAEAVLDQLTELIRNYDVATVTDLYNLVGIKGSYTDDKWGWYDMRGSRVSRVRDGYLLDMPKTQVVD